jgi:hypothetical protein
VTHSHLPSTAADARHDHGVVSVLGPTKLPPLPTRLVSGDSPTSGTGPRRVLDPAGPPSC